MTDDTSDALGAYQRTGIISLLEGVAGLALPPEPPASWDELAFYGWPNLKPIEAYWRERLNTVVEDAASKALVERSAHNLDILDGVFRGAPWQPLFVSNRDEDHFRLGMAVVVCQNGTWQIATIYSANRHIVQVKTLRGSFYAYAVRDVQIMRADDFRHLQKEPRFAALWASASGQITDFDEWYGPLRTTELS